MELRFLLMGLERDLIFITELNESRELFFDVAREWGREREIEVP